jgi:hypothetical protein
MIHRDCGALFSSAASSIIATAVQCLHSPSTTAVKSVDWRREAWISSSLKAPDKSLVAELHWRARRTSPKTTTTMYYSVLPRAICTTYASANHNAAQQPLQRDRQADVFRYAVCLTHNCLSRVPFHVFLRHRPRPRECLGLACRMQFDSVQSPSFWKWKVGQTWSHTTWTGRPLRQQDHEASTSLRTSYAGISQ